MNEWFKITGDSSTDTLLSSTFRRMFYRFALVLQKNILSEQCVGSTAALVVETRRKSLEELKKCRPPMNCTHQFSWRSYSRKLETFLFQLFQDIESVHPDIACAFEKTSSDYNHEDMAEAAVLTLMLTLVAMTHFHSQIVTEAPALSNESSNLDQMKQLLTLLPSVINLDPAVSTLLKDQPTFFLLHGLFDCTEDHTMKELCKETLDTFQRNKNNMAIFQPPTEPNSDQPSKYVAHTILTNQLKTIMGLKTKEHELVDISESDSEESADPEDVCGPFESQSHMSMDSDSFDPQEMVNSIMANLTANNNMENE